MVVLIGHGICVDAENAPTLGLCRVEDGDAATARALTPGPWLWLSWRGEAATLHHLLPQFSLDAKPTKLRSPGCGSRAKKEISRNSTASRAVQLALSLGCALAVPPTVSIIIPAARTANSFRLMFMNVTPLWTVALPGHPRKTEPPAGKPVPRYVDVFLMSPYFKQYTSRLRKTIVVGFACCR